MTSAASSHIHTVALVGHGGAGKTTLAEALLYFAGVIPRRGRVEDGTTVCDFEPEEVKRHFTVATAVAPFNVGDHKFNVLDTPGFVEFLPEVELALAVADVVVVVVSAVEGVEVQTEVVWRMAAKAGIPRVIFVNKLDRERADFERTVKELQDALRRRHRPDRAADRHRGRFSRGRRPALRHGDHLRGRRLDRRSDPRGDVGFRAPDA